jgi:hypothetical protein
MNAIIDLPDKPTLFAILAGVFTIVYIWAQGSVFMSRRLVKRRQEELYQALSHGLLSGAINTVEDLVNVYKGIHERGADDVSYQAGLSKALRGYIVRLVSNNSHNAEEARKLKENVSEYLKQIESEAPFLDLPPAERNILIDTQRFIGAAEYASANKKLKDLAGLIEVRQEAFKRLQHSNKWSIPFAVIGLVLTVVFGVMSFVK